MTTELSRFWIMPSRWTFKMKPIKPLFDKYRVGKNWIDPFSGKFSPAEITNDIEDRGAKFQMDGFEFLKSLSSDTYDGVLFDPPYSVDQCLKLYTPKFKGTAGRAEYWAKCKDEIARVLKEDAIAISFGWDSCGIGKNRGFEIVEVMLLCHGAAHNDTIVTVDVKGKNIRKNKTKKTEDRVEEHCERNLF
jgi:hypothetical protein